MPLRKGQSKAPAVRTAPRRAARKQTPPKRRAARQETALLRQRLTEVEAELASFKDRHRWVESALADQRHARQVLEASIAATYPETVARIREVVRAAIPHDATVLVVSKGDDELLKLEERRGWHFPQNTSGDYAGYHPADSAAAIEHLQSLIRKGAQYLLLPNTAFWWLEHYHGFREHLDQRHLRIWRDARCALYKLQGDPEPRPDLRTERRSRDTVPTGAPRPPSASAEHHHTICFPIINWDYRFQRPQQMMRQFAAAGHRVFYLSHEFRKSGEPYTLRPLAEGLHEVALRGSHFKIRADGLDEDSRQALLASLTALRNDCLSGSTVAIVQSAFWWPIVQEAAAAFGWPIVYDCMDHHAGFSTSHPLLVEQEKDLFARADLVVASSVVLEVEARKHSRNVLLLRNGCDYEHFAQVQPRPRGSRPVIGYFGAIAEWFDSDLVAALAKRRPDWDFILIGSTYGADVRRLAKLRNVSLPGEKPYAEIPTWLAKFDVTLLPFKRSPLTEATNPVKAYEIFAAGKPLVSVPLPEMVLLAPLVRLASTVGEFESAVEAELKSPRRRLRSQRQAFAKDNTWEKRMLVLSVAVQALLAEQTSHLQARDHFSSKPTISPTRGNGER